MIYTKLSTGQRDIVDIIFTTHMTQFYKPNINQGSRIYDTLRTDRCVMKIQQISKCEGIHPL